MKKCYREFEEIVFLDQDNKISKSLFYFNYMYDKRYQARAKKIDLLLDQIFNAFDRNQDGSLSFQEFLIGTILFESDSLSDRLKIFFSLFDISKDKQIEKNEIEQVLNKLNRSDLIDNDNTYSSFAQEMIQDLDFDKDGSISEDEFIEVNIYNY